MPTTNFHAIKGVLYGQSSNETEVTFATDASGSLSGIVSSNALLNSYRFTPFGILASRSGSSADPSYQWLAADAYRITGRLYSDYAVGPKSYSSTLARFSTPTTERYDQNSYYQVSTVGVSPGSGGGSGWVHGVITCYGNDRKNCCTNCDTCFDPEAPYGAALPKGTGQGWGCGDVIECCRSKKPGKCITIEIRDTGNDAGRLVDLPCGYAFRIGFLNRCEIFIRDGKCRKVRSNGPPKKNPHCDNYGRGLKCDGYCPPQYHKTPKCLGTPCACSLDAAQKGCKCCGKLEDLCDPQCHWRRLCGTAR